MKYLPLTQEKRAIIDEDDFELLSRYKWYAAKRGYGFYAQRHSERKLLQMHRVITNAPKGMDVDHINGNTLDNRKKNLRVVSRSQNEWNRTKQRNNTTGYKGVTFKEGKYLARIRVFKKLHHLGYFKEKVDAANAYNLAAIKFHGEFALLNKV